MTPTQKIVAGGAAVVALGAGALALRPNEPTITLDNPQRIVWQKPTTDAEWAEDVKAENFDLKSTEVLQEMADAHTEKLARLEDAFKKYEECPECIRYDLKESHPDWTQTDIDNEFTNQYNQQLWSIEKLKQSIERMNKEVELRDKGFTVPDKTDRKGTPAKMSDLEKIDTKYVRKIND